MNQAETIPIKPANVQNTLKGMILSASGWRGVFAPGGEEDTAGSIANEHRIIAAAAAEVFAEYLRERATGKQVHVFSGSDTRPTGRAIADAVLASLTACGCTVRWAGFAAAPEIMAWTRTYGDENPGVFTGFIYISASHNPIGHNGIKFGLSDGGVLPPAENAVLVPRLLALLNDADNISRIEQLLDNTDIQDIYAGEKDAKIDAFSAYTDFADCFLPKDILATVRIALAKKPLGLVCDFNGSARAISIDRTFFENCCISFKSLNSLPGNIVHRIVPEGESLEPARAYLDEVHKTDPCFTIGYTPDCDGDRGNLVIWSENLKQAVILGAQEIFALVCVAEISQLVWTGELANGKTSSGGKAAIVVNDPTSLRIDRIAAAFGIEVHRAEVGEANVVALARKLRESGCLVKILGEGSNGGSIIHPSAVRDPLGTVLSLVKLLAIQSTADKPGLFEIWCKSSGQTDLYHADFTLADTITSLPVYTTTGAYEDNANLKIKIDADKHGLLKKYYQQIFLNEWEQRKESLKKNYDICTWEAAVYNGIVEKRNINQFEVAGSGGLKICFSSENGEAKASIWMRGSMTEDVFRIMADAEGKDGKMEQELIEWQRSMVTAAYEAYKKQLGEV